MTAITAAPATAIFRTRKGTGHPSANVRYGPVAP